MLIKQKNARRLSVWLLIFSLLAMTATSALTIHATPFMQNAQDRAHEAGQAAGDMARGITDGVGNAARDAADGVDRAVRDVTGGAMRSENGTVSDDDGVIGNESNAAADAATDTQATVGRIALIVVIVAAIIAVIIIVLLIPKKRKD